MAFDFFDIIKFSGKMAAKREALLELVDFIHHLSESVQEELIHTPKSSAKKIHFSIPPVLIYRSCYVFSDIDAKIAKWYIDQNANISRQFCIASRENSCCIVASVERLSNSFYRFFFETQRSSGILQVLFLRELEEVLEATQAAEF